MNKENFISELVKQTGLTQEQGAAANDVFEGTFLAGNKSKDLIVSQLVERVSVDEAKAEMIYTVGIGLLSSSGALDKVTGLFK
jgi:hypothetical protein